VEHPIALAAMPFLAGLIMLFAVVGVVVQRCITKQNFSVRAIQFIAISSLGPIEPSAIGALLGALIGYMFGSISKYDERNGDR
jgi:hypothetical protein